MPKKRSSNFTNKNPEGPKPSGQRCKVTDQWGRVIFPSVAVEIAMQLQRQTPSFKIGKVS